MPQNLLNRFFLSIVLPSILAIGLYILSIFLVILPAFERNAMDGKKEMISELTRSVISLIEEYRQEAAEGIIPEDSARKLAIERVQDIRYGEELKDYFWIVDMEPRMIMHPYRPELNGRDLTDYTDPEGKLLFVESVRLVEEKGEGFIDYIWQWKDDSTRLVPKLSFVRGYPPWDWVVGTGIYLEDVRTEIGVLKRRLLRVGLIITLVISVLLAYMIRQSLGIERRRKRAEQSLRLSREKYRSLVQASTQGTLMWVRDQLVFSNLKFSELSGFPLTEVKNMGFEDLFTLSWEVLESSFRDPTLSVSHETELKRSDGTSIDVVISASRITYSGETGYIIVIKEVSEKVQMEREQEKLTEDLQSALTFMNVSLRSFARDIKACQEDLTIREAAAVMVRKQRDLLFVRHGERVVGVVTRGDLTRRVLVGGTDPGRKVIEIMSSPVVSLPESALLYEGMLEMKRRNISHIALHGPDGEIRGAAGYREILEAQHQTTELLIHEIETTEEVDHLATLYLRLPVLVKALLESGSSSRNITRIITLVGDAIHRRLVNLALEEHGPAPCSFAFIVMGSQGRGEQTLLTDQDNAIIYEKVSPEREKEVRSWFLKLGKKINDDLDRVGYRRCKGGIMAGNTGWSLNLDQWKVQFGKWIRESDPQSVMDAAILFDFRHICGEGALVEELREHVYEVSTHQPVFFYHMAQSVIKMKAPVTLFGNIRSEPQDDEDYLDLKRILLPVTSFIRLYALREKQHATNSLERAEQLHAGQIFDAGLLEELTRSFDFITLLRIRNQARLINNNEPPENRIDLHRLSQIDLAILKRLSTDIAGLQTRLTTDFSSGQ